MRFPCEALAYSPEDIGGAEGAEALLKKLRDSSDSICEWMREHELLKPFFPEPQTNQSHKQQEAGREREKRLDDLASALVALLNRMLRREEFPPGGNEAATKLVPLKTWERTRPRLFPPPCWRALRHMRESWRVRAISTVMGSQEQALEEVR